MGAFDQTMKTAPTTAVSGSSSGSRLLLLDMLRALQVQGRNPSPPPQENIIFQLICMLKEAGLNRAAHMAEIESQACFDLDYFVALLESESVTDVVSAEKYFHAFIPSCTPDPLRIDFRLRSFVFLMLLEIGDQNKARGFFDGPLKNSLDIYEIAFKSDCSAVTATLQKFLDEPPSKEAMEKIRKDLLRVCVDYLLETSSIRMYEAPAVDTTEGVLPVKSDIGTSASRTSSSSVKWSLSQNKISCLKFHTTIPNILLCGTADGLISIWKVTLSQAPVRIGIIHTGLAEPVDNIKFENMSPWICVFLNSHIVIIDLVVLHETATGRKVIYCGQHPQNLLDIVFYPVKQNSELRRYIVSCGSQATLCQWGYLSGGEFFQNKTDVILQSQETGFSFVSMFVEHIRGELCIIAFTEKGRLFSISSAPPYSVRLLGSLFSTTPRSTCFSRLCQLGADGEFVVAFKLPLQPWMLSRFRLELSTTGDAVCLPLMSHNLGHRNVSIPFIQICRQTILCHHSNTVNIFTVDQLDNGPKCSMSFVSNRYNEWRVCASPFSPKFVAAFQFLISATGRVFTDTATVYQSFCS